MKWSMLLMLETLELYYQLIKVKKYTAYRRITSQMNPVKSKESLRVEERSINHKFQLKYQCLITAAS